MAEQRDSQSDWELSDDYYQPDDAKKELKLEDFMEDGKDNVASTDSFGNEALARTINEVKQVMAMAAQGANIETIAKELNLDSQYVYNIQVTAQGFREDDEIAVAHLIMMDS